MPGIFKVGERVKVVAQTAGHGVPLGTELTVSGYNGMFVRCAGSPMNFYEVDLVSLGMDLDTIKTWVERAEIELTDAQSRLKYMTDNNLEELNEKEFVQWCIEDILSSDAEVAEKIKRIKTLYHRAA